MRHTRNRQIVKLGHKNFKYLANNKISLMRKNGYKGLDPNFQWHRDFHGVNIVSFNRNGETFKTYVIKGRK